MSNKSNPNTAYAHLKLKVLPEEYKYVLLDQKTAQLSTQVATLEKAGLPFFIFSGGSEASLLISASIAIPGAVKEEASWRAFRILGDMPFGTVQGLIATLSSKLKEEGVGVCVVSSFLTDYFFIREKNLRSAMTALRSSGWEVLVE